MAANLSIPRCSSDAATSASSSRAQRLTVKTITASSNKKASPESGTLSATAASGCYGEGRPRRRLPFPVPPDELFYPDD
jgi:hypothetical protein